MRRTPLNNSANNLAWLYAEGAGNLDEALQLAQTAKSQLRDQPEVNDTLGWIYIKKNLASRAIPLLRDAVEKEPANAAYQYHLALAYNQAGQSTQAKQAAQKALQLKQDLDGAADARRILTHNP